MKLTDRYIASSFIGPFCGGVAAFLAIILGVSELYWLVRLIVNDGVAIGVVLVLNGAVRLWFAQDDHK